MHRNRVIYVWIAEWEGWTSSIMHSLLKRAYPYEITKFYYFHHNDISRSEVRRPCVEMYRNRVIYVWIAEWEGWTSAFRHRLLKRAYPYEITKFYYFSP